jgi:hypothetical protein
VIVTRECLEFFGLLSQAKGRCTGKMILESSTAERAFPEIGVHKGEFYINILSSKDHGLKTGDELIHANEI